MTAGQIRICAVIFCVGFWCLAWVAVAHAAPAPRPSPALSPVIEQPKPITIKCPCVVTIADGSVAIDPGAVLSLSGTDLAIQTGHWSSDSAAVIQNVPLKPERDR